MVFKSAKGWFDFPDDSELVAHESAFWVVESRGLSVSGIKPLRADSDARKSARYDIHQSAPRLPVKCGDIIPDWKRWYASVILSRHEDALGVVVDFNGADNVPSEKLAAEYAATMTREKRQLIH